MLLPNRHCFMPGFLGSRCVASSQISGPSYTSNGYGSIHIGSRSTKFMYFSRALPGARNGRSKLQSKPLVACSHLKVDLRVGSQGDNDKRRVDPVSSRCRSPMCPKVAQGALNHPENSSKHWSTTISRCFFPPWSRSGRKSFQKRDPVARQLAHLKPWLLKANQNGLQDPRTCGLLSLEKSHKQTARQPAGQTDRQAGR